MRGGLLVSSVSRVAGDAIGADSNLPNMGMEDFLVCLSRQSVETVAKDVGLHVSKSMGLSLKYCFKAYRRLSEGCSSIDSK